MSLSTITILAVNWYSTDYLSSLFENLANKASDPDQLIALIVDNTNGSDSSLEHLNASIKTTILRHDSQGMKSSRAHAAALDFAMKYIDTPYCLIIDPDVHVFKKDWDKFCISEMEKAKAIAIGAPYPGWKLGKYHDFPSPIFNFFNTKKINDFNIPWTPFGHTRLYNFWVFCVRQITRMGGLMTRRNYENRPSLRRYARFVEKTFGTFSQDTGWRIAKAARQKKFASIVFQTAGIENSTMVSEEAKNVFGELTREYEVYCCKNHIMLTHKYGTGVYLWKTKRGEDKGYWFDCIKQLEKMNAIIEAVEK